MEHRKADVLIIGGGLSGLMAAKYLIDNSQLRPLILSDGRGASPWIHGISVPVSRGDSEEAFYQDVMASGRGLSRPELIRALSSDARSCLEGIQDLGLEFNRQDGGYQLLKPLGASYPRVVSIGNETGPAILEKLCGALEGKVDRLPGRRALRLRTENGRAVGALVCTERGEWMTIAARSVILASGGFCGIYPFSTNKHDSGGDGAAMAYEAGCRLTDMEFIQFEPSAAVWPPALRGTSVITTMFYEGAVLRDRDGKRFMLEYDPVNGERVCKEDMARRIAQILARGRGTDHGGVYFDATGVGETRLRTGYPAYVERYKRVNIDITREMMEIAPAPHTALGGVMIGADCRTDVPGLYACGEVTGGIHGAGRIGGNAGLEALVFGRRAGESCARDVADMQPVTGGWEEWIRGLLTGPGIAADLRALRRRMEEALAEGAGVLRTDERLRTALDELEAVREQAQAAGCASPKEEFERLRLLNDLTTARLVCRGAYERKSSVGCHTRLDGEGLSETPYRLIQSLAGCVKEEV